ncbi:recombinase family protein [Candidatus Gracilibacteria bacterium]|nr:recombinase family protein [Candidatus Gracilibacteria bacterium]
METCFVYLRKSTDRKDKQQASFELQTKAVIKILKKHHNLEVIGLDGNICDIPAEGFIYESQSAKQGGKQRPEFNKMLEAINKYECDYVIVWKPSRISRNSDDMISFLKLIEGKEKKIHKAIITKNGYYDVNSKINVSNLEIDLAQAKKDNSEVSESVKDRQELDKSNGIWPHRFPFGYKHISKNVINIVPEEMLLVRLAFNMRLKGCSFKEIADEFIKKGYNKDGDFIGGILSHQIYTGIFEFNGEEKAIKNIGFEVIVGPETFYKVQEYNKLNKRKHGTSNINKSKNQNSHYLDKMVFDVFGKALQPYKSNKTGKIYYRQSTKNYNYKVNIGEQKLFDEMEKQIINYNLSDEMLIILKESFLSKISVLIEEQKSEIKYIKSEILLKEKKIDDNIFEIGRFDNEELKKIMINKLSSFQEDIVFLKEKLKEKENTKINYEDIINNYLELFKDLPGTYKKSPKDEKANILRGLGIKFIVGIDKTITIESEDFLNIFKN